MKKLLTLAAGGLSTAAAFSQNACPPLAGEHRKMNVLLLIADDMRPELGCYGVEDIRTPHIDRLAATGMVFRNAYCNIPVSGASRASLFTGMYPVYPHRFTSYDSSASKDAPTAVPLQGWFTSKGYYAVSNGKVFHNIADHAEKWSEYPWRVYPGGYGSDWAEYNKWELWMNEASGQSINPRTLRGPFCEAADVEDEAYDDGKGATRTIEDLKRLGGQSQPFFLACGFWRPHLPFNVPRRYWDMYERDKIPLPGNPLRPKELPEEVQGSKEIYSYAEVNDIADEAFQRKARHGYYAAVSYVDAQIGRILNALDELGLAENTIVVLLGDHGWHLGEYGFWGKHTLMKRATRVPLIVRVPGVKGGVADALVELVDLYPTLCDLCGIGFPRDQLEGRSFVPALFDPHGSLKKTVYIQWQNGNNAVTLRYSYAEWKKREGGKSRMLFDHRNDPEENENVAYRKKYKRAVRDLSESLSRFEETMKH